MAGEHVEAQGLGSHGPNAGKAGGPEGASRPRSIPGERGRLGPSSQSSCAGVSQDRRSPGHEGCSQQQSKPGSSMCWHSIWTCRDGWACLRLSSNLSFMPAPDAILRDAQDSHAIHIGIHLLTCMLVQYLDMRGRPGLLRTILEAQETRGLTRSDDISRLLPSEVLPHPSPSHPAWWLLYMGWQPLLWSMQGLGPCCST